MEREAETWRTYLDGIILRKNPAEKKAIYEAVGVTRTTIQRWRSGENIPDPAHIYRLLQALEAQECDKLRALMQQDPKLQMPDESLALVGEKADRIPQHVYEEILRLSRDAADRFWLIGGNVLFHLLLQLNPEQTGVEILITRCMPPRPDGKIRSLRAYAGRGTPPWRSDFHTMEGFFGAESLAGYVVTRRHAMMIPDIHDSQLTTPLYCREQEQSSAAVPIMREGKIAGALVVSSSITHFFTDDRLTLLEKYADLIRLAFFDEEFYLSSLIELGFMPDLCTQQSYFSSFRQRVTEAYKQSVSGESLQEVSNIEQKVRQDIETELLRLASLADTPHPV